MNIVFFGNTKYSLIDAETLHEHFGLTAIVTIPDRENLSKKTPIIAPTKQFGIEQNIPLIETTKLTDPIIEQIEALQADFFVVADYRLMIPDRLLEVPKTAPLNVHHSLLPKYRGPAPAQASILNGDKITGVTIMRMVNKMDAGDIFAQREYELRPDDTMDSLLTILNQLGAKEVIHVIENFNTIKPIKQDESKATFTSYIQKEDGYIDPENPPDPVILDRMIRAYYPWPGVWSKIRIKNNKLRIKFLPSSIVGVKNLLPLIQIEGKKPQTIKDFINGYSEGKAFLEKLGLV